jgi:hypothetical protein
MKSHYLTQKDNILQTDWAQQKKLILKGSMGQFFSMGN